MHRRNFLRIVGYGGALTISFKEPAKAAQRGPSLLIIQTDEHNFRTLGCYGGKVVGTPNIDWLAKNGALCTSFYATSPVCTPSRAAFVSGRYPHRTGAYKNNVPMKDEIVTFAEMLRLKGYATGYAGKWHLDGDGKPQWRPTRKFGFEDNRYMFNRGHWKKMGDTRQGPRVAARNAKGEPNYDVNDADETSFTTDWLTTKAISFIKAHRDQSFCYMLSIPDPHGPNTVRKPYDSMFGADQAIIPRTLDKTDEQEPEWAKKDKGVDEDSLRKVLPKYYGMVRCIDDNVGRILNYLRRNELIDKTVVVFTSDHGDLCGEHGKYNKGNPYEGSAKIPFIVYYPEEIRGGTVVDRALSCIDFLPTILNLMGVEPSVPVDGRDASPFLRGGEVANWKDMAIMRGSANWLCAVTGEYKLVYSVYGPAWFFDLKKDPDELINCFSHPEYKELVSKLTHELIDYCEKYEDPTGQVPAVKRRMLAAL